MSPHGNNDPSHTPPLNDDTRNDTDGIAAASSPHARWVALAVIALFIGWGVRNWTAQNSPQPLPFGPIVDSQTPAPSEVQAAGENASESDSAASNGTTSNNSSPAQEQTTVVTASSNQILVHVAGHVANPGVYALPSNARVQDAIARAGGVSTDGDAGSINQAAWLRDGQRIEVAARPPAVGTSQNALPGAGQAGAPAIGGKRSLEDLTQNPVDLNTASSGELCALPDVGPGMAARIIAFREQNNGFHSVADLDRVPGIGQKRLEALRPLVTAR